MNLEIYDALTVTSKRFCTVRIGSARVSTDYQTLDLQRDTLKRVKCRHTYEEHASGKNTARPELDGCLKALARAIPWWVAARPVGAEPARPDSAHPGSTGMRYRIGVVDRQEALGQMAPGDTTVGFTPSRFGARHRDRGER
jgi:hypothetical protein